MYDRSHEITAADFQRLHDASMEILRDVGVAFYDEEALAIFKSHGIKVDGRAVFPTEEQIRAGLKTAPERFKLTGRDPEKSVWVGRDDFALAPGYGAPFIVTPEGDLRSGTMADYDNFCKLAQTSPSLDMNGFLMVEPSDVANETAYLDMMLSNILLCDRPFMGAPLSRQAVLDSVEMAAIAFGGRKFIEDNPVMIPVTSVIAPLRYSEEMAAAMIEFARAGQPVLTASLVMAGSSGPVTLAGVIALQNAEILAGMLLTQLVRPGVPYVYGASSCPIDMKTGALSMGAPETMVLTSATAQMARFYNLPSRAGGTQTDGHAVDYRAGAEAGLNLLTTLRNGINFVLHAVGIMSSYSAMSFEKYLADEEVCGMVKKMIQPIDMSDEAIDLETIAKVGIGGQFLTQPKTFKLCRTEFYNPVLADRLAHGAWHQAGAYGLDRIATEALPGRLEAYAQPDIDPAIAKDLAKFVVKRKAEEGVS